MTHGKSPLSTQPVEEPAQPVCENCGGDGWYIDHADECYEAGDCVGCGGVQVECDVCE